MRYHVIVPAAGAGERFGGRVPKPYALLNGKPVLQHAIERVREGFPDALLRVVLAADDRWFDEVMPAQGHVRVLRCGGDTRAQTVRNALLTIEDCDADDWVIVHDAARPCLDRASCVRLRESLANHAVGGLLALPVSDTLKRVASSGEVQSTESRDGLWRAQTPQMFRYRVLRDALALADDLTDEAQAVERLGSRPRVVMGNPRNIKITYAEDLELASALLGS